MKKILIWALVVIISGGLGVAGAWGLSSVIQNGWQRTAGDPAFFSWRQSNENSTSPNLAPNFPRNAFRMRHLGNRMNFSQYPGMQPGAGFGEQYRGGMGPYGMHGWEQVSPNGERISIDDAVAAAQNYIEQSEGDFRLAEVMEFSRNFYVVVEETSSGHAAFELLVDPYSGTVYPEPGPNRMWNAKYGCMRTDTYEENAISMQEAVSWAQNYLDQYLPSAKVEEEGLAFYGYYTFDYLVDGKIAGMLSVHGSSGEVWLHTWHGDFIDEMELEE